MQWREVYSSSVNRIAYDPATQRLHVEWQRNGKVSQYDNVPPEKADAVMNAWSVGKAVRELQKDEHPHSYLGDDDGQEVA